LERGKRAKTRSSRFEKQLQEAWDKMPKYVNGRAEIARAQRTTLLKLAAVYVVLFTSIFVFV